MAPYAVFPRTVATAVRPVKNIIAVFQRAFPTGLARPRARPGDRWPNATPDRDIGGLWEDLSEGKCAFVMVTFVIATEKNWNPIRQKIAG